MTTRPSARSTGPMPRPATIDTTASGTGARNSDGGIRNGKRTSSPYAAEFAAACETGAESVNTAVTRAAATAITAEPAAASNAANTATATMVGASTRRPVRPQGRGANNAS